MAKYKRSPFLLTYWNEDNKIILYNYNRQTKAVVSKDVMTILNLLSDWRNLQQLSDQLHLDKKNLTKFSYLASKETQRKLATIRWE